MPNVCVFFRFLLWGLNFFYVKTGGGCESFAVKSSATSAQTDDQVMSLVRKLQGRRATPKKTEEDKQGLITS